MRASLDQPVSYNMPIGEHKLAVNPLLGSVIRLHYQGAIHCIHCSRKTSKSFSQGYCYPCFKRLARCDLCIMSPERCHYDQGTCREPGWGETHCMKSHYVYLANSSGVKVGITRARNIPARWIDQGAVQALPVFKVDTRYQSGLVEVMFKQHVADKTNWRVMLRGQIEMLDLVSIRDQLFDKCADQITELQQQFGIQSIQPLMDADTVNIDYPVLEYPTKVTSLNFDKTPEIDCRAAAFRVHSQFYAGPERCCTTLGNGSAVGYGRGSRANYAGGTACGRLQSRRQRTLHRQSTTRLHG